MATDKNGLPRIITELRKIQNSFIDVGILSQAGGKIVLIASSQEFGATIEVTERVRKGLMRLLIEAGRSDLIKLIPQVGGFMNIPSRSFVRSTFDNPQAIKKAFTFLEFGVDRILAGDGDARQAMKAVISSLVSSVQLKIRSNIEPENNPITKALKASDQTLVVEGRMSQSVTGRIGGAIQEEVSA